MPEQLSPPSPRSETDPLTDPSAAPWWRIPALHAAAIVAMFLVAGVAGGFLVQALWEPPEGLVYRGKWQVGLESVDPFVYHEYASTAVFSGVGWFVALALGIGLLLGLVASLWLARSELVTLAAVVVGAVAGGGVMYAVSRALAPTDPTTLEKSSEGSVLPDTLHLGSPWISLVMVAAALAALVVVFLIFSPSRSTDATGPSGEDDV